MRAPRFPLHLPARCRRVGDTNWRQAETENISRSGVLFRVADPVPINTTVEIRLVLPGGESAEVACLGRVVRVVSPSDSQPRFGSAIAIEHYEFLTPSASFLSATGP